MNINGLELGKGGHSLLQLCLTLKEKGFDIGCITEKMFIGKKAHVYHNFRQSLKDAWPNHKKLFLYL